MGKERRGKGRREKRRGGEREGLPPLEWRSGYAPAGEFKYLELKWHPVA